MVKNPTQYGLMKSFPKKYDFFKDREGRAAFIAKIFKNELAQAHSVLDVGCDYNTLKKIIGPKVIGVDLYGNPDFKIDFEKEKLSRFGDREFDLVVCTEVLEHLENFHAMIDELARVSDKYILISLPNCMDFFTRCSIFFQGKAGKFYGLPFEKPEDRHRWFFNHLDLEQFFHNYANKHALRIADRFLHCNFGASWEGTLIRFLTEAFRVDSIAQSYWILLEKEKL